ncbi:MAG: hypothetical protein LBF13_04850 [Campylobacteraceae bacterium]|jgi:hypothetical protein|nr:hypothetical protein [Campylobacteraceae bacterium]
MIKLITKEEFAQYVPPKNEQALFVYKYIKPFIEFGSEKIISNLKTEPMLLEVDDTLLPLTKNEADYKNSYVCSLYTHYITYAKEELDIVGAKGLKIFINPFLDILGLIAKLFKINKVVIVNNFALSTNLYYPLNSKQYRIILDTLKQKFPQHLILFRSLNEDFNEDEIKILSSLNCSKIASRRVYLLKKENIKTTHQKHIKKDKALMKKYNYHFEKGSIEDTPAIKQFYDGLYLGKYSKQNPAFTEAFFKNVIENSLFNIQILKCKNDSKGFYGLFSNGMDVTASMIGYSKKEDSSAGFYRVLSLWGVNLIEQGSSLKINRSSGVSDSKRFRGAVGETEYSMFFSKHLPLHRRIFFSIFSLLINKIALPIMIRRNY